MKNLLFVSVIFIFYVSFSSCKKEYNCTCISTGLKVDTTLTTYNDMDKSEAEELCASKDFSFGGIETVCSLE